MHFDMTCCQCGVDSVVAAPYNLACDGHNRLKTCRLNNGKTSIRGIGDTLGQTIMIAHIDKYELAMITLAIDPAGNANFFADRGLG